MDLITPNRLRLGRNNDCSPAATMGVTGNPDRMLKENRKIFNSWFEVWLISHVPRLMNHPKWFSAYWHNIKNKLSKLCKEFSKENFNIKLVFNSFKIKNYFSYKDPIPDDLKSFLVYKFTCASCRSSHIDKTCRHFKTRIEEHIKKDNKSHIFKRLHSTTTSFES